MLMSPPEDDIVNVGEDIIPVIFVIQETDPQPGSPDSHHLTSERLNCVVPHELVGSETSAVHDDVEA